MALVTRDGRTGGEEGRAGRWGEGRRIDKIKLCSKVSTMKLNTLRRILKIKTL